MNNLFPSSCGYEVAKAWCPVTDFSFLGSLLITGLILILVLLGLKFLPWWIRDDGNMVEL